MKTCLIRIIPVFLAIPFFFLSTGCVTTDGGSGGWVVVDSPSTSSSPHQQQETAGKAKGMETAARNHIRSAYRFLEKDKPDHAMRELEKARAKMGQDYWFQYYLGGAFYLKAQYSDAEKSWDNAYRYTRDTRLRSRIMTCRSFAQYRISGQDSSAEFLRKALDLDDKNESASHLLDDLKINNTDVQDNKPGLKGKKVKTPKMKPGKDADKSEKRGKKIQDRDQFMDYFLVEMPMEPSNVQRPGSNVN